ncbi:MAG: ExbD/TolR family protein [Myxococcaceae bacterium]
MSTKRKKFTIRPSSRPNSDINVTPLVDVVLVLLIIFMVVTPLLEKDIDVKVPETEQLEDPTETPPQDQLIVALAADGKIAINNEPVTEEEYVNSLKRKVHAKQKGDRLVFFMAEEKTNYASLIKALDGARVAGADTLGMMTETSELSAQQPGTTPTPEVPTRTTP